MLRVLLLMLFACTFAFSIDIMIALAGLRFTHVPSAQAMLVLMHTVVATVAVVALLADPK